MKIKKPILLAFVLIVSISVNAQDLIVKLTNSNIETFVVSDIQSIKFDQATMILKEFDGTVNTWSVNNIDNYKFDNITNISQKESISTFELNIFPNPTTDDVTVNFISNASGLINIAIYDVKGRFVEEIYNGNHNKVTKSTWSAKQNNSVQSGKYLIRINTENKVITKQIIIQQK